MKMLFFFIYSYKHSDTYGTRSEVAFSLDSFVRIGLLSVNTMIVLDVLECLIHPAAIAALVALRS